MSPTSALAFPTQPQADESLAGFIARATAANFLRSPLVALSSAGIRATRIGSLCTRPEPLAPAIAAWAGTDVEGVERMFERPIEGRPGWVSFFGEPLRAMYRQPKCRRVAPGALKNGEYMRATWPLRPLSFDPESKEMLIDSCPVCKQALGWTRTYGIAYCDNCKRMEKVGPFEWDRPAVDLRDFPQPRVEVEDEEALDFLVGLIDPAPGSKERSRKLVPDMWSQVGSGDLFEVGVNFASMLDLTHWDKQQAVNRRGKGDSSWSWLTPHMLAAGGRALIDGQKGYEAFGDLLRRELDGKPRANTYGKWAEIGPLSIIDRALCDEAKAVLVRASDEYYASRRGPDMMSLYQLARKHGVHMVKLSRLARSGLVPTIRHENVKPVLMSESLLIPLLREMRASISAYRGAMLIGVHTTYMDELQKIGLLDKVGGPVLELLKAENYFTRESVDRLARDINDRISPGLPKDGVRLRVAIRASGVQNVPWAGIVQSILDGSLKVYRIKADKSRKALGDRLAVHDAQAFTDLMKRLSSARNVFKPEWIGNAAVSQLLGVNENAVWRLAKEKALKKHDGAPLYSPFKRSEVERLSRELVFAPEVARLGKFKTFREASAWLKEHGIAPQTELKQGGWKGYPRAAVEDALTLRRKEPAGKPASKIRSVVRPEFVRGPHPLWIKRKLLNLVGRGHSVHQASITCEMSYATAKRWVRDDARERAPARNSD